MNIIWIHGFGEDSTVWSDFLPLIRTYFNSHLFDFSQTTRHTTIKQYAQDLALFIEEKQIEKPVLIGHSMGGYIALEFASKHPESLNGLGLFHSTAKADLQAKKAEREKTKAFIKKFGSEKFIQAFYPNMFSEHFRLCNPDLLQNNIDRFSKISSEALASATESMKNRRSHLKTLSNLAFPVFQIIGKLDAFVPLKDALKQTSTLQKPNVLLLDNVAHAGMYEAPEMCAGFINNYLENLAQ